MLMPYGDCPEGQQQVPVLRFPVPQPGSRLYALSRLLASAVPGVDDSSLLWITGYGIWPSSENLHLYYRLRESYGDRRLLAEAPAHLCLKRSEERRVGK